MSTARRLARLEGTLSPTAATLLWLAEAHAFPNLPAYAAWLLDQPVSAAPLVRVPKAAEAGARAAMAGERREVVEQAVGEAIHEAIFLVELVLAPIREAESGIRWFGLRCETLSWQRRAIVAEAQLAESGSAAGRGERGPTTWSAWTRGAASFIGDVYLLEEARGTLERRYLDGQPALFPEAIADWGQLRDSVEGLVGLGATPGAGRRRAPARRHKPLDLNTLRSEARRQAPGLAAQLVGEARAATLGILGDGPGATAIVARWLRSGTEDEA